MRTMRTLAAVIGMAVVAVVAVVVVLLSRTPAPSTGVRIGMSSNPFPSSVGMGELEVLVTQPDGTWIKDAKVQVTANMMMPGMLPLNGRPVKAGDGQYNFDLMWPMPGEWQVDVAAALPNGQSATERFDIYVYPVPPFTVGGATTYRAESEVQALLNSNPAREYWIVIPQGTMQMQRTGQGENMIPAAIDLSLSGQNTLVIRNDDIADHLVGPFFVRAGETIRQEFTRAATYVGKCTLRHGDEVSIVVS
jgi:hypothetical protein